MKKLIIKIVTEIIIFVVQIVILMKKFKQLSPLVMNSKLKFRPYHLTEPTKIAYPTRKEAFDPNQVPLDFLTKAFLPAKLVTP